MRLTVRPVFVGWLVLLTQIPMHLFMTLWAGLFFGGMTSAFFPQSVGQFPYGPSFMFFGGLAFFGIPLVTYIGKKLNYARTEYKFSQERLEFEEGFFSLNKKVIMLRDVKEVTLRKGFFQRSYGLGSIYLATLATGSSTSSNTFTALGFGNVTASGIVIRDMADPDRTYEQIMRLVHNTRRD